MVVSGFALDQLQAFHVALARAVGNVNFGSFSVDVKVGRPADSLNCLRGSTFFAESVDWADHKSRGWLCESWWFAKGFMAGGAFRKLWFGVEVAYVTTSVWHSKLRLVHCVEPLTIVESLLDPPASPFASQGEMDQATPRMTWHVQLPTGGHVVDKVMLFKPEVLTTWSSHVITSICMLLDCLRYIYIYIHTIWLYNLLVSFSLKVLTHSEEHAIDPTAPRPPW